MPNDPYSAGAEEDLPRTVRQQKAERARDQLAQEALATQRAPYSQGGGRSPPVTSMSRTMDGDYYDSAAAPPGEYPAATVRRLHLPFFHMVGFFIKAVFAAIPAIIIMMLMIFAIGKAAEIYLPWLVKMKIEIKYNGAP